MPKQIINAIGLLVVLGVLAAGVALVALPLYLQSLAIDNDAQTVAASNAALQAQVDALGVQKESIDDVTASVEQLRVEIPAAAQLDDVFEVVAEAADRTGATIGTITANGIQQFLPPSPQPITNLGSSEATVSEEPVATDGASGSLEVPLTVTVRAATVVQATAFIDALRAGPRLVRVDTVTVTDSGDPASGTSVNVSITTFLQASNPVG